MNWMRNKLIKSNRNSVILKNSSIITNLSVSIAQWLERRPPYPEVEGSSSGRHIMCLPYGGHVTSWQTKTMPGTS